MEAVAIIGAGSIGLAWSIVFARAGMRVRLFDPDQQQRAAAIDGIAARIERLHQFSLIHEAPEHIVPRIAVVVSEEEAVADAVHVQECVPEDIDLKRRVMTRLDRLADGAATIASSTSFIPASKWAADLPGRGRCLVIHPGNPPYLIPVVEIIAAPFTDTASIERAQELMVYLGQKPILVGKEIEGFVFNRLQGAVLREAYCLVRDGIATVEDIDTVVRDGLGLRWSFMGPFETVDLNTRGGIEAHAARMGPAYRRMGIERGQDDPWTPSLVAEVSKQRRAALSSEDWCDRVQWRDEMLMRLLAFKQQKTTP